MKKNKNQWSLSKILSFFNLKKTHAPLPEPDFIDHCKKYWERSRIPLIGEQNGFLKKPNSQKVISFYTAKGGVLKTTLAYEFSNILALNGVKVLAIGLDIQCSLTDMLIPKKDFDSLSEVPPSFGVYHYLFEKVSLSEVIQSTSLPNLDIIPETSELNLLEKKLRDAKRREYVFKNRLLPNLKDYDVIIFDNSPSWNLLIENALTASNNVISPAGCEIGTYQSLQTNLDALWEFKDEMELNWDNFFLVPTMLDHTKLSQQIYKAYKGQFSKYLVGYPIKRSILGQEAVLSGISILEYERSSPLAKGYYGLVNEVWLKILSGSISKSRSNSFEQVEESL